MEFLVSLVLQVLVLLVVVPAVTANGVAVRQGGFFRGLIALVCIGLTNMILWFLLTIFTVGMTVLLQFLTFGLVGLLINALAIRATGSALKDVLYVKSFGSALGAALTMVIANCLIRYFLF
jgi:uncharacterized membrane protein YvlD (DUF360 family)